MMGMSSKREILHEDMSMCSSLHMMDQDLGSILNIKKDNFRCFLLPDHWFWPAFSLELGSGFLPCFPLILQISGKMSFQWLWGKPFAKGNPLDQGGLNEMPSFSINIHRTERIDGAHQPQVRWILFWGHDKPRHLWEWLHSHRSFHRANFSAST